MEDAVKALIIAAGVLIGLMVISLGVTLFTSLGKYSDDAQEKIEGYALQKFNEQFLSFINCADDGSEIEFTLTIHDIITAANIAYENNQNYGLTQAEDFNYYVTVNMPGTDNDNLQNKTNSKVADLLKENLDKKYICAPKDVQINPNTGRVCVINFSEGVY